MEGAWSGLRVSMGLDKERCVRRFVREKRSDGELIPVNVIWRGFYRDASTNKNWVTFYITTKQQASKQNDLLQAECSCRSDAADFSVTPDRFDIPHGLLTC